MITVDIKKNQMFVAGHLNDGQWFFAACNIKANKQLGVKSCTNWSMVKPELANRVLEAWKSDGCPVSYSYPPVTPNEAIKEAQITVSVTLPESQYAWIGDYCYESATTIEQLILDYLSTLTNSPK